MINDKPLISILTSVYNTEKYIGQCIESVLNQSFINYEFIIIDDGSTDKTAEIIEKYAKYDKRIRFFKKNNTGIPNSLNFGIGFVNSNYILKLDADDIMLTKRIEIIYKLILKTQADIVVNRSIQINSKGVKIKPTKKLNYNLFRKYLLRGFSPFAHSGVIFKKDKIIELGFYSSFYEKSCDYDLWLRMLKAKTKFYFCNQTLTGLRIHNESLTFSEIDYYSIIALMNYKLTNEFNNNFSNEELISIKDDLLKWLDDNYAYKVYRVILKSNISKFPILKQIFNFFSPLMYYFIYLNFKEYAKRISPTKFA